VPAPWLDGKHQVFGRVLQGMDIIDAISKVQVDEKDHPVLPVTVKGTGELIHKSNLIPHSPIPAPRGPLGSTPAPAPAPALPTPLSHQLPTEPTPTPVPAVESAAAPTPVPELKLESAPIAAASLDGQGPAVTRYIWFDLEQDGMNLGRVTLGL
jgi:hypothetical protein